MKPCRALAVLASLLAVTLAACGGSNSRASPPASSPSTSAASPSASLSYPPASGNPCALASASQAAAALGEAVGKAQPRPAAPGSGNGAKGSTCQWVKPGTGSEGYGGSVGIGILAYPSAAIASKLFKSSADGTPSQDLISLPPGLAPGESASVSVLHNVGSSGGTRTALAVLLSGNKELSIDLAEPTSQHFSRAAFVTLVKQVAQAWS
jgi:hypothetical protein